MKLMTETKHKIVNTVFMVLLVAVVTSPLSSAKAQDMLPSWNDGAAKTAILEFVAAVTDKKRQRLRRTG